MSCFDIGRDVVLSFLQKGEPFTIDDVKKTILNNGGVMRVAPNFTITEYLQEFIEIGTLKVVRGVYSLAKAEGEEK